jgi:hypothetical protein
MRQLNVVRLRPRTCIGPSEERWQLTPQAGAVLRDQRGGVSGIVNAAASARASLLAPLRLIRRLPSVPDEDPQMTRNRPSITAYPSFQPPLAAPRRPFGRPR